MTSFRYMYMRGNFYTLMPQYSVRSFHGTAPTIVSAVYKHPGIPICSGPQYGSTIQSARRSRR